jgi:nitrite reductase (NADH) large subunit
MKHQNIIDGNSPTPNNPQRIVVVGNGMVGHKFIENLATEAAKQPGRFEIITFCEEPRLAYDRVHLSEFFDGKSADDLSLVSEGFYENNNIKVLLGEKVDSIDRVAKTVSGSAGSIVEYDKLVLATGSYPFVPPVTGHDRDDIYVYRTIEDLEGMLDAGNRGKIGTVVGGGLLGLEAANALKNMGLESHVVEFAPNLMGVQLDDGGSDMLKRKIAELGVTVHTSKNTKQIVDGAEHTHRMEFADGTELETDMIVFSAGIRPRDELAKAAELEMGERGGILVNDQCQTSDPDIFAIGECALYNGMIYGLVAPGYQMAQVAVDQICGSDEAAFTGADMSTKLKLLGVDVCSIGDAHGRTEGCLSYSYVDENEQTYKRLVVSADKTRLLGAVLIGDGEAYGNLLQLKLNDMDLPENPEAMILPSFDGSAATGLGVDALPDTAQICSCNDVSKGDLCAAIADGVCDMGELKACTKAGTSCGGCVALTKQVLDSELEKAGVEVDKSICEHFAHTRQELEHIVRVEEIKTFTGLLQSHGKGHGCEICKPAVASILASTWNEYVLKPTHVGLQDTNDRALANMQKNGTYSVVPRVPGGEITPDKLIVLGEVAKEFNLYSKITGGQRIDLFGAQLHELPLIWKKLVDAGFETGQAYGKSLRTVKSCVGSTWCRYGMLDSVGMAIRLEERYKGLRSPHKIKFAVSGCTRECAEAQSKDIGVIATENGWNLYVSGNGGMKPRHGDLLASDLDDDTLIKYIDRYLMFYVRTADRLQRTSTWLDNLEGGLEYAQDVVINDSLNINAELEAQMELIVDTFQCEWKTTIEDPERLKYFRHFVNSDKQDEKILFVKERGQIRPATPAELEESQS